MTLVSRRPRFIGMLAVWLAICSGVAIAATTAVADDKPAPMCWSPSQLRKTSGEHRIYRNLKAAFVDRPVRSTASLAQRFPELRGRAIRRVDLPEGVKRVAFTFDLCEVPHEVAGYQGDVVDTLRSEGVKATFFAGGKWLLTHRERAQQILGDPLFDVGNHAWEHRNFQILTGTKLNDEIDGASAAYEQTYRELGERACLDRTGLQQALANAAPQQTTFRFPFGACSTEALEAVHQRGMVAVQWDVSSGDSWAPVTAKKMIRSVMGRVKPGSIVLFHANGRGRRTAEALPAMIKELKRRGYEFVTVDELLRTPGARIVSSPTCYDSRPGDTDRYQQLARKIEAISQRSYARHHKGKRAGGPTSVSPSAPLPQANTPAGASRSATPVNQPSRRAPTDVFNQD